MNPAPSLKNLNIFKTSRMKPIISKNNSINRRFLIKKREGAG